jgi:hypothetical protein
VFGIAQEVRGIRKKKRGRSRAVSRLADGRYTPRFWIVKTQVREHMRAKRKRPAFAGQVSVLTTCGCYAVLFWQSNQSAKKKKPAGGSR